LPGFGHLTPINLSKPKPVALAAGFVFLGYFMPHGE
jgi:hypothetical protein